MANLNTTKLNPDDSIIEEVLTLFWTRFEQRLTKPNWSKSELQKEFFSAMHFMKGEFSDNEPKLKPEEDTKIFFKSCKHSP